MKVVDLGALSGELLVFGGPCSNLQATQAVLEVAQGWGIVPSNRICTGDAVAYGGDPVGVVAALDGACHWIAGNCEKQLSVGADDCGCGFDAGTVCDRLSADWYGHASRVLDAAARNRMGNCPDSAVFTHAGRRYAVIHGGVTDIARFIWPVSPDDIFEQEIHALRAIVGCVDVVLAGHAGVAFQRQVGDVLWVNAGIIGVPPHDRRVQARYVLIADGHVTIERLDYDHAGAAASIRAAGLGEAYARAIETGVWPSEDVLPLPMRRTRQSLARA